MSRKFSQILRNSENLDAHSPGSPYSLPVTEMNLPTLRKSRQKSQSEIASILEVNQAEISKMERRPDMYISTLINFVQALGGSVEIIARFPEAAPVRINQFALTHNSSEWNDMLMKVELAVLGDSNAGAGLTPLHEAWSFSPQQAPADTTFCSSSLTGKDWFNEMLFHPE